MQPKNTNTGEHKHLHAVLVSVLKPLVRFLLHQGLTYPAFIQTLRGLYVEIAEQENLLDNEPQSISRVSLLTGIARRYVREIRQEQITKQFKPLKTPLGAKLIAQWTSNSKFLTSKNKPSVLPRLAANSTGVSFEELAILVSSEIRPRTQLDNLLERGMVAIDDKDRITLLSASYVPDLNKEEMLSIMAQQLHDHISSASSNIMQDNIKQLDRSAYQEGLSQASVNELKQLSEQLGMEMLNKIYSRASELANEDHESDDNRFRLGFYSYSEDTDKD